MSLLIGRNMGADLLYGLFCPLELGGFPTGSRSGGSYQATFSQETSSAIAELNETSARADATTGNTHHSRQ